MEFGIGRAARFDRLVDDAQWAERHGFRTLTVSDHLLRAGAEDPDRARNLPASDPFVQLAGIARETTSIELAIAATASTFRHPAIVLKSAIELDLMSGGRFTLGVGTGYRESEHEIFGIPFPSLGERYELLEDTLGYLRAGLSVQNPGFEGRHYRLYPHPICPAPSGRVRLLVGGSGVRRTPEIAGRFADEFNVFPMEPKDLRIRIERARAAAREAGRDPEALVISSGGPMIAAADRAELREALAESARHSRIDVDDLEQDHRENHRLIGTYDEVAARLHDLAAVGVSRFYIVFEGDDALDREQVLAMISAVAP